MSMTAMTKTANQRSTSHMTGMDSTRLESAP